MAAKVYLARKTVRKGIASALRSCLPLVAGMVGLAATAADGQAAIRALWPGAPMVLIVGAGTALVNYWKNRDR